MVVCAGEVRVVVCVTVELVEDIQRARVVADGLRVVLLLEGVVPAALQLLGPCEPQQRPIAGGSKLFVKGYSGLAAGCKGAARVNPKRRSATWVSVSSLSWSSSFSASSIIFCSFDCSRWLAAIASAVLSSSFFDAMAGRPPGGLRGADGCCKSSFSFGLFISVEIFVTM